MRVLRTSFALAAAWGMAPTWTSAQVAPQDLLTRNKPVFAGVDYDFPSAAVTGNDPAVKAAVDACKVETSPEGYTVKDAQGRFLRKFLDANGKKTVRKGEKVARAYLDQWSYYLDGFEVYREIDEDDDGYLDEVRWMNSGGTRIAKVQPAEGGGSKVVAWTRISPEEASKVLVQAIVLGDRNLLDSVIASPEELQAIAAPAATIKRATEAASARADGFLALRKNVQAAGWTGQTVWSRFDGAMPHVIPADAAPGLKNEFVLYENVVIFPTSGNPEKDLKIAYLSVPEVVKIGDAWKFVDLPHAVDPANPVAGRLVSLRTDIFNAGPVGESVDPKLAELLKTLNEIDVAGPPADGDKRALAKWHVTRANLLREVIAETKSPAETLNYQKQVVNDLAEAVRTGMLPDGMGVMDKLIAEGGKIGSFAAYRKILVEFDLAADQPGSNILQIQKDTLVKFEEFLTAHPDADEVPEVLFQLATVSEFNGDEEKARRYYGQLAKDYAAVEAGLKAAGALRRMDSDGKALTLAGPTVEGKPASVDDYRGKPLLVVFWTSLSEGDQREMKEIAALREKLGAKGFEVLGVSLDDDRAALDAFLKANPMPWATIHEPGGMDGRLANEMGVISTPTMILLDSKGQVANRRIKRAAEVEKALEQTLARKGVGLNMEVK